ncbi:MAG: hypothetical protein TR69_WS6001001028 [candidate division WS6 bacterium OLB20]|uniref:Uncharacterized protein n=1 Tax=candidate division WS6 bacterium OLB20 TaxID=1617426 RepID=A0A136LZD3_9BACT|nr:MAG: hypothetical protein TR69_WS6001001028 [candidate division WS6 bacterium OLB20]
MSRAKLIALSFTFVDLFIGFIFGSIGHFFGIMIFPLLAIVRGSLTGVYLEDDRFGSKLSSSSVTGAVAYFIGMNAGVFNLMFVLTPRYDIFQQTLSNLFSTEIGVAGSIAGSVLCGTVYMLVYFAISNTSGVLAKQVDRGYPASISR